MTPAQGADLIASALSNAGVRLAFGLPGVHNLALYRACHDAGIRIVGGRHEQATVYAADGLARCTGTVGVALTTTGPGAANAVGATGEAWASGSPVVVVSTDIPTAARRPGVHRGSLHECADQPGLFRPVTKATLAVTRAGEAGEVMAEAIRLALAPPTRPVYLEIATDLLSESVPWRPPPAGGRPGAAPAVGPPESELRSAIELISAARRPVLWVGAGARNAGDQVRRLAEALVAPVIATYSARGVVPSGHPLLLEAPPHEPAVARFLATRDLTLVIGSDLDAMMTMGWRLPLARPRVAVNVDPADATKNYPMDLVVAGDAGAVLDRVIERLGATGEAGRRGRRRAAGAADGDVLELREIEAAVLREIAATSETGEAAEFLSSVASALPPEAVVFADMAVCGYWLAGYHRVAMARGLHYPMGWGTLGFAFPAAIGAAAATDRPVISFSGDGGFLFAAGELATMAQERLPLTAVVVDDAGYGMLRFGREGDPRFGTELLTPDFAALAGAFGIRSRSVEGVGGRFADALHEAVRSGEPNLLWTRARLYPPPTTSPRWRVASQPGAG